MSCTRAFSQACLRETVVSKNSKSQSIWSEDWIWLYHWSTWIHKTKNRVSDEKDSWRTHCRERAESVSHNNVVHKFIPMHQAMKIPDAKAAVDKEWKKLENLPAWDVRKVKSKKEVVKEAQKNINEVHFASLTDSCHLKNSESKPQVQKYKGRVVLRGHIVKDDSGDFAVFTEQGSSASQMTAAKVMDIIFRLPGCAGQAADAVSAYTQVKMEDAPTLLKIPKSECPDIWMRLPKHKWPKSWSSMEDPVVLLERKLIRTPTRRALIGKTVRKNIYGIWLGKNAKLCLLIRS